MSKPITANMVAGLRTQTGAGLMDCKKALTENDGDADKAIDWLRKQGIAAASKRTGRDTKEGRIEQYIHTGNKVGTLLEINCETDFVAKNETFQQLAKDICMHITAAAPEYVSREDVPQAILEKEHAIIAEGIKGKAEAVREQIVQGRLNKIYGDICLLEQPFVKNPDQTIQDLITETINKLGENIVIKRFVRYHLGEE